MDILEKHAFVLNVATREATFTEIPLQKEELRNSREKSATGLLTCRSSKVADDKKDNEEVTNGAFINATVIELRCNNEKSDFGCCPGENKNAKTESCFGHLDPWDKSAYELDNLDKSAYLLTKLTRGKDTTELDTKLEHNTNVLTLESDSNKDEPTLDKDKELDFVDFVICKVLDFFQGAKKKCMLLHDVIFGDDVDLKFDKENEFSGDPLEDQAVQDHGQVPAKVKLERLEPLGVVDEELSSALGWECEVVREAQSQSYGQPRGEPPLVAFSPRSTPCRCRSSLRRTTFWSFS